MVSKAFPDKNIGKKSIVEQKGVRSVKAASYLLICKASKCFEKYLAFVLLENSGFSRKDLDDSCRNAVKDYYKEESFRKITSCWKILPERALGRVKC